MRSFFKNNLCWTGACWFILAHTFFFFLIFIYLWLCWVVASAQGLSLVVASGGHSSSRCAGLSLSRPLLLRSTGSRRAGSVVVAHGPSCSAARGIVPDQGLNPCPLHWQADSQPLRHQGSPGTHSLILMRRGVEKLQECCDLSQESWLPVLHPPLRLSPEVCFFETCT